LRATYLTLRRKKIIFKVSMVMSNVADNRHSVYMPQLKDLTVLFTTGVEVPVGRIVIGTLSSN